jgi:hypothetical protein
MTVWALLLAFPAVQGWKTLLDKPAMAPLIESVIIFENCHSGSL